MQEHSKETSGENQDRGNSAKDALAPEDMWAIRKGRGLFVVLFSSTLLPLCLFMGILLPIYQYDYQYGTCVTGLRATLAEADEELGKYPDGGNGTNPFDSNERFLAGVSVEAMADGKVDSDEIIWYLTGDAFRNFLEESPERTYRIFTYSENITDEIVTAAITTSSGDFVFLAGQDFSSAIAFLKSINTIGEITIFGSYVFLSALAFALSGNVFGPIRESMKRQRAFVADASHELKTPLSIISANAEVLRERFPDSENAVNSIISQSTHMAETINELISLSLVNSAKLAKKRNDVSAILYDVCLSFDAVCYESHIRYDYRKIDHPAYVMCSDKEMRKLFEQLLDNAVKYVLGPRKIIVVKLKRNRMHTLFSLSNSGGLLSREEAKRIFDRFYRSPEQRAKVTGGTGLGLSICKAICDKCGFRIWAEVEQGIKTTIWIKMPNY